MVTPNRRILLFWQYHPTRPRHWSNHYPLVWTEHLHGYRTLQSRLSVLAAQRKTLAGLLMVSDFSFHRKRNGGFSGQSGHPQFSRLAPPRVRYNFARWLVAMATTHRWNYQMTSWSELSATISMALSDSRVTRIWLSCTAGIMVSRSSKLDTAISSAKSKPNLKPLEIST